MITLPSIRTPNPNKPLPPSFRSNAYYHFFQQNGHNMNHFKHHKYIVQDLIDFFHLSIKGVNVQGNKFIAHPNQNLQIFTNPFPNHNITFVKASETSKNDVMNVDTKNYNNDNDHVDIMIRVIDVIPHKYRTKNPLDMTFTSKDKLKNALDGHLYIAERIYDNPTNGILIDLVCGENMITGEFLVVHEIHQETYDKPRSWIKMHNGFSCPTIGTITLPLRIGPK
jgi:hypothetical protein